MIKFFDPRQNLKPISYSVKDKKRTLVDMSLTTIHHGHIRILKKASEIGLCYSRARV